MGSAVSYRYVHAAICEQDGLHSQSHIAGQHYGSSMRMSQDVDGVDDIHMTLIMPLEPQQG